jgi:hypothetical protein
MVARNVENWLLAGPVAYQGPLSATLCPFEYIDVGTPTEIVTGSEMAQPKYLFLTLDTLQIAAWRLQYRELPELA